MKKRYRLWIRLTSISMILSLWSLYVFSQPDDHLLSDRTNIQSVDELLKSAESPRLQEQRSSGPSTSLPTHYDANDFYYFEGKRIKLHRSLHEAAVLGDVNESMSAVTGSINAIEPTAKMIDQGKHGDYRMSIVQLPKSNTLSAMQGFMDRLQTQSGVAFTSPVFIHPLTGTTMILTDELVVQVKPGETSESLTRLWATYNLVWIETVPGTDEQFLVKVLDPKMESPLDIANTLVESGRVEWAEPNFVQELKKLYKPNDPGLALQWHLIGSHSYKGNRRATNHINAPRAWDQELGRKGIVIAIVDDGVRLNHRDLKANIFRNRDEIPKNGIDDDDNGYIDDIHGWDFHDNDNNPSPSSVKDNHGTAVAGVAAARGDNGRGVSGACPRCSILSIKIAENEHFVSNIKIAKALRYAATHADVINLSWGDESPTNAIRTATRYALRKGRNGKGSIVLAASGNDAKGYIPFRIDVPAGTHRFSWIYSKDGGVTAGADTAWLGWIDFPGGKLVDFEGAVDEWRIDGDKPWSIIEDPTHADEGICRKHAAKAGPIGDNQISTLETIRTVPAGRLTYYAWVDSEKFFDGLSFWVDFDNNGIVDYSHHISGQTFNQVQVSYPAAYPGTIAVGATTDRGCRADYSQFGRALDIVAPSNGGPHNLGIATTDRIGSKGYHPKISYTTTKGRTTFGGTSSATPLVAGVVGLMLSRDPSLTSAQVREVLHETADKVGLSRYDAQGRNDRYGYGQINAARALEALR